MAQFRTLRHIGAWLQMRAMSSGQAAIGRIRNRKPLTWAVKDNRALKATYYWTGILHLPDGKSNLRKSRYLGIDSVTRSMEGMLSNRLVFSAS